MDTGMALARYASAWTAEPDLSQDAEHLFAGALDIISVNWRRSMPVIKKRAYSMFYRAHELGNLHARALYGMWCVVHRDNLRPPTFLAPNTCFFFFGFFPTHLSLFACL